MKLPLTHRAGSDSFLRGESALRPVIRLVLAKITVQRHVPEEHRPPPCYDLVQGFFLLPSSSLTPRAIYSSVWPTTTILLLVDTFLAIFSGPSWERLIELAGPPSIIFQRGKITYRLGSRATTLLFIVCLFAGRLLHAGCRSLAVAFSRNTKLGRIGNLRYTVRRVSQKSPLHSKKWQV